jgi:hypothetical protein
MRRLALALAAVAPLVALGSVPATAGGWGYSSYGYGPSYCPPYRSYYYSYRPTYGYRPYYGAYWRPRFYSSGYFYRPFRPWAYRSWGYRPYRAWGYRPYRAWGYRGWGHRGWGWRAGWRRW